MARGPDSVVVCRPAVGVADRRLIGLTGARGSIRVSLGGGGASGVELVGSREDRQAAVEIRGLRGRLREPGTRRSRAALAARKGGGR
jgi:hypothetical protein